MKVYTKIVIDVDGNVIEEESFDYDGPFSECKGPSSQTQTVKNEPPKYLKPYYRDIASRASNLADTTNLVGQSVAQFSPETEQAFGMIANRAANGSPLTTAANNQILGTIRGDYMNGPQFQQQFQSAFNKINPQIDSAFASAGRLGSGLADAAKTEALGNAFAGLVGQERQNQINAAQFAPQLAQQDYFDAAQLGNVGAQRQSLQQAMLDANTANSRLPWDELGLYSGILNGIPGGTQTSSQPLSQNRGAGALGGAMLGNMIMPGIGGIIGGGLLGAL